MSIEDLLERLEKQFTDYYSEIWRFRPWQRKSIEKVIQTFSEEKRPKPFLITLPTGYGKTMIGFSPFLYQLYNENFDFASWLCYILPTRVLCNSLLDDAKKTYFKNLKDLRIKAFHGGIEDAEELFSDVAITTFDTFILSYARRTYGGLHLEKPAGFITTSCLVFDEAHMINDEYLYSFSLIKAVIEKFIRLGIPIIFMTATMPEKIKEFIFKNTGFHSMPEENAKFSERPEQYRGTLKKADISKKSLKELIRNEKWKRLLVVCNTVERAVAAYDSIEDKSVLKVLIHSRLRKDDRVRRERLVKALVRPSAKCKCENPVTGPPYYYTEVREEDGDINYCIVCEDCAKNNKKVKRIEKIAVFTTQVVEAGLNISSDLLITDLSPADSLVQRCGRCARFKEEKEGGMVYIIDPNISKPYPENLIRDTRKEVEDRLSKGLLEESLIHFDRIQDFVNFSYITFRPEELTREMQNAIAYFKGRGLSTFTVDWKMMHEINARPEAQITLAVPTEVDAIEVKKTGDYLVRYKSIGYWQKLSLSDLLIQIFNKIKDKEEKKFLAINSKNVALSSFSINLGLIDFKKKKKNPQCLIFEFKSEQEESKEKRYVMKLFPFVIHEEEVSKVYIVRPMKESESKIEEGVYLVNPKTYDEEKGLVKIS